MEDKFKNQVYTREVKAGRKRRYYIDVKKTRQEDYYLVITESKRNFNSDKFIRHKIFVYKEDLNKFQQALEDAINHIKTELLPDYNFERFSNTEGSYDNKNWEDSTYDSPDNADGQQGDAR